MEGRITWVEPELAGPEAVVSKPPSELPALRAWAQEHGVADRLGDPAKLLAAIVPLGEEAVLKPSNGDETIAGLLAAPPPSVPKSWTRAGASKAWELDIRARADRTVRQAAVQYLHHAAMIRASVLARREHAALHDPPAEARSPRSTNGSSDRARSSPSSCRTGRSAPSSRGR
jgi:hypothetical protein